MSSPKRHSPEQLLGACAEDLICYRQRDVKRSEGGLQGGEAAPQRGYGLVTGYSPATYTLLRSEFAESAPSAPRDGTGGGTPWTPPNHHHHHPDPFPAPGLTVWEALLALSGGNARGDGGPVPAPARDTPAPAPGEDCSGRPPSPALPAESRGMSSEGGGGPSPPRPASGRSHRKPMAAAAPRSHRPPEPPAAPPRGRSIVPAPRRPARSLPAG